MKFLHTCLYVLKKDCRVRGKKFPLRYSKHLTMFKSQAKENFKLFMTEEELKALAIWSDSCNDVKVIHAIFRHYQFNPHIDFFHSNGFRGVEKIDKFIQHIELGIERAELAWMQMNFMHNLSKQWIFVSQLAWKLLSMDSRGIFTRSYPPHAEFSFGSSPWWYFMLDLIAR